MHYHLHLMVLFVMLQSFFAALHCNVLLYECVAMLKKHWFENRAWSVNFLNVGVSLVPYKCIWRLQNRFMETWRAAPIVWNMGVSLVAYKRIQASFTLVIRKCTIKVCYDGLSLFKLSPLPSAPNFAFWRKKNWDCTSTHAKREPFSR